MLLSRARSAQKGAFLGPASQEGIAILFPDTSPRGAGIEGEDDDWDFGTGVCRSPRVYKTCTHDQFRCWLLPERNEPEVREALQHAQSRHR